MHGPDDSLGRSILTLTSFINDPRQDGRMMAEAGLDLDPVFLPLLVRLGLEGPASVVELAARTGRDHSIVSRHLSRLQAAGLVERAVSEADGRVRMAQVTARGQEAVAVLAAARRRLLDQALAGWTLNERAQFRRLFARFADTLTAVANESQEE